MADTATVPSHLHGGTSLPDNNSQESMSGITEPYDTDVLCGRGGAALRHPGNQTYRRLVNLNKGLYVTCLKTEKLKISRSIVAAIREQKGRFLEKDNKTNAWFDIGDKKAIEKTSQALREGQPKIREKLTKINGTDPNLLGGSSSGAPQYGTGVNGGALFPPEQGGIALDPAIVGSSSSSSGGRAANGGSSHDMSMPPPPLPHQHSNDLHQQMLESLSIQDILNGDSSDGLHSGSIGVGGSGSHYSHESANFRSQQQPYNPHHHLRPGLSQRDSAPHHLGMPVGSQFSLGSQFSAYGGGSLNGGNSGDGMSYNSMMMMNSSHHDQNNVGVGANTNTNTSVGLNVLSGGNSLMSMDESYRAVLHSLGDNHGANNTSSGMMVGMMGLSGDLMSSNSNNNHARNATTTMNMMPPPQQQAPSHSNMSSQYSNGGLYDSGLASMMQQHQQRHQQQQQQQQQETMQAPNQQGANASAELSAAQPLHAQSSNVSAASASGAGGLPNVRAPDRRQRFAMSKFHRPPSGRGLAKQGSSHGGMTVTSQRSMTDGMPDIHMVESSLSLYSNLSNVTGHDGKPAAAADNGGAAVARGDGKQHGMVETAKLNDRSAGTAAVYENLGSSSKHSIMSGLSRISDSTVDQSIFSQLSQKIGNVSTRSMAMSEISAIDMAERDNEDDTSTTHNNDDSGFGDYNGAHHDNGGGDQQHRHDGNARGAMNSNEISSMPPPPPTLSQYDDVGSRTTTTTNETTANGSLQMAPPTFKYDV